MTRHAVQPVIRRAELTDVPALGGLVEKYWRFEQIPGFERARIEGLLRDFLNAPRHGSAWVAALDSALVGYLLVVNVFSLENGGQTAEIDEFFVAPDSRGFGIGVALLVAAEESLRGEGVLGIALQLGKDNESARAFYTRQGYAPRTGYDLLEKRL